MSGFFASGHAVDLVLCVLAVEILLLVRWARVAPLRACASVLPGFFLLLALRAAVTGAAWTWLALWLTLSLPAHLADLALRRP